jgi:Protein of unknown function (DUF2877)
MQQRAQVSVATEATALTATSHAAHVVSCGQLACLALGRSGGVASPIDGFEDSPYLEASGEILWVGSRLPTMHPRAVVTASPVPRGLKLCFDAVPAHGWSGQLPLIDESLVPRVIAGAASLRSEILSVPPKGFGAWLAGHSLPFPLSLAASRLQLLSQAYAIDDADAAFEASAALLGFGIGLTPSGDDLAGAALFGRLWITRGDARWKIVGERLVERIAGHSHRLSAALFGDLVRGQSFAPLHDLAQALAADQQTPTLEAARKLVDIGHSSGWDMLTGFVIGVTGVREGLEPGLITLD